MAPIPFGGKVIAISIADTDDVLNRRDVVQAVFVEIRNFLRVVGQQAKRPVSMKILQ